MSALKGYVDQDNNPVYAHAALATFVYDQELDDYVQGETKFIADTNDKEWKTTTCSFSNGSEDMIFGVFATYAPSNLYIHDIKIEQNYKAGDTFMKSFDYYYRTEGVEVEKNGEKYLSLEIPLVGETAGKDVYHRMQSVRLGQAASQFTSGHFRIELCNQHRQYGKTTDALCQYRSHTSVCSAGCLSCCPVRIPCISYCCYVGADCENQTQDKKEPQHP